MARTRHQGEMIVEYFLAMEIGSGHALVEHGEEDVQIAGIERRQQLRQRAAADLYLEPGSAPRHPAHGLWYHPVEQAGTGRHADRDRARGRPPEVAELLGGAPELRGDAAGPLVEHRAVLGEPHASRS